MGYKTISTRRTSATSAISSGVVVVNTDSGLSAVGSTVSANTSISLSSTVSGQTTSQSTTVMVGGNSSGSSGPTISTIQYLDANNAVISNDIAVSTAGGNILITGSGFVANSSVYLNNYLVSNTFISSTQIRAVCPAASAGNVSLMIFTPTLSGTIKPNGVRYSGAPSWTTAAVSFQNNTAGNVLLVASSDSTLTYTLQAGSTLPAGISLNSAGYLAGTATGYSTNTSSTAVIIATDLEGQATQQTLNITITTADPQFNYTTLLINGETTVTPFIADASTNNFPLTIAGDARADKFSPYRGDGYYSVYNSTASSYLGFSQPSLGNTFTIEMWVYPLAVGNNNYYYVGGSGSGPLIGYNATTFSVAHQGGWSIASSVNPTLNAWNHIALVREGTGASQFKLYLNGTLTGTGTDATTFGAQTTGAIGGTGGTSQVSYISNFRIVNNQVLYTGNFSPSTTPLTASTVGATGANVAASITGTTVMMAAQSATFVDKSASPLALTPSGGPIITPAIPFAASSTYATYGSMYVPSAVTNYLSLAHTASTTITSGSTDSFIAEFWMYCNSVTASTAIIDQSGVNSVTFQNWSLNLDGSKKIQLIWGATGSPGSQIGILSGSTIIAPGVWYHIAFVKTNADWAVFVNGTRELSFNGLNTASDGTSNPLRIGSDNFSGQSINGYIADLRIYKGATAGAPYIATNTTLTVPTAPLTAIANTQLLTCQYNGGANNYGIIDNSPFNNPITRAGNATQGTFSPYSPTGWSNYFGGSDYLTFTGTAGQGVTFGSGDFTVELWYYMTNNTTNTTYHTFIRQDATTNGFDFGYRPSATQLVLGYAGVGEVTASTTLSLNTWNHIAVSRSGTSLKFFVNGAQVGTTATNSYNFNATGTSGIGRNSYNAAYTPYGYISNIRASNAALYTSAFTPSTGPLTATANTTFLSCQSNRFKDNSTNNFALTATGTPSIQAVSPFPPAAAYTPSLHGGSAYFDGTGDYLTTASSTAYALGSSDFTIELWYNTSAKTNSYPVLVSNGNFGTGKWQLDDRHSSYAGKLIFGVYGALTSPNWLISTSTIVNNTWYHVAIVRSGSTFTMYLNGVAEATATYAGAVDPGTAQQIYVGQDAGQAGTNYNGNISDIRILKYAAYTTAFAPPTAPLTSPTATPAQLLLNFTNGGVVDQSGKIMFDGTSTVQPQINTSVKKYGSASLQLTSTYMFNTTTNQNLVLGTGDFTFECWIYWVSTNYNGGVVSLAATATSQAIDIHTYSSTGYLYFAGSARGIGTLPVGTWNHYAIVRQSGTTKFYLDGVYNATVGAVADATNYTGGILQLGYYQSNLACNAYIDDLRITKGFARYTANFTPPTSKFLGQ
jgi:hypothetical protein